MIGTPKKKRIKLNTKEYHELRLEIWYRCQHFCEICKRYIYNFDEMHVHHNDHTRGAGGDDVESNVTALCYVCHDKKHRGLI
jgi:hypothetical protein